MTWYTAHIIMYIEFKDGCQDKYPFWENLILIEAEDDEDAFTKAEIRGRQDEGDSQGTFTHESRPATWVFGGIRRLVECVEATEHPSHGTELSYSEMEVVSEAEFQKVINGESVMVWYGGLETG